MKSPRRCCSLSLNPPTLIQGVEPPSAVPGCRASYLVFASEFCIRRSQLPVWRWKIVSSYGKGHNVFCLTCRLTKVEAARTECKSSSGKCFLLSRDSSTADHLSTRKILWCPHLLSGRSKSSKCESRRVRWQTRLTRSKSPRQRRWTATF